ncbi:MAG: RNA polymerase sigma factor [Myxococcota bacterium]|nr:RNA polymerase sigma factor [Myxococcota bacterium]
MLIDIGESAAGSAVRPMIEPSDKVSPRSVQAELAPPGLSGPNVLLDQAMNRYARGEDDVFELVYRQGAPRLRGFLVRMCSNAALADDLTQDAFLRIHLARGSFVAGAPALPWMLAIARNAFLDHIRRDQVRRSAGARASTGNDAATVSASPETHGDEVLVARELLGVVRLTLDRMPTTQREAFVLLRFEGLSVREAAHVLGATESAVKVRAFRAYEAIRAALEQETGGSTPRQ